MSSIQRYNFTSSFYCDHKLKWLNFHKVAVILHMSSIRLPRDFSEKQKSLVYSLQDPVSYLVHALIRRDEISEIMSFVSLTSEQRWNDMRLMFLYTWKPGGLCWHNCFWHKIGYLEGSWDKGMNLFLGSCIGTWVWFPKLILDQHTFVKCVMIKTPKKLAFLKGNL